MSVPPLITFTDRGIYCAKADVYIDPWKPVPRALITHGHSDHARYGHKHYLATVDAVPVIKFRLGSHIQIQGVDYGQVTTINGVKFSFHPAGHIIGSAQIKASYKGETWVISGDYKLEDDGISTPFEPVKCQHFITESTFGLPAFQWKPQQEVMDQINAWWQENQRQGKVSILSAYSLGKAQRIINNVDHSIGPIFTHGAVENTNEVLRKQGKYIASTTRIVQGQKSSSFQGGLVIGPPAASGSSWARRFGEISTAAASGWMAFRGARRRRGSDVGFVLSDHVDWPSLNEAVKLTEAAHIYVTHGYTDIYSKYLRSEGYDAHVVKTEFVGEESDQVETES